MIRLSTRALAILALVCQAAVTAASAGTVSVAWSPIDHPDLAGYRVYWGPSPGALTQSLDVGPATAATLQGLANCTGHYVAVKAVATDGGESPAFSNLVSGWPRPTVSQVSPAAVEQNSEVDLIVQGTNFQPGASVTFSDPALTVDQVVVSSCTQLIVSVSVGPGATQGPGDLEVVNPDQVFGVGADLFAVVGDATAPAIAGLQIGGVGATSATVSWTTDEPSNGQVFFRPLGETTYQTTPLDPALETDHVTALEGLKPETTYGFHVVSADALGNAATSGADLTFTTQSSSFAYLRVEAEAGALEAPLQSASGTGAFASAWIELAPGTPPGSAGDPAGTSGYGVYLPRAAEWTVWLRVHRAAGDSSAWLAQVDGGAFEPVFVPVAGAWTWVWAGTHLLDEGLHALALGGKAAGARADRLLVTDDPDFTPTEQPGDDVSPPPGVAGLAAVNGDGIVSLSWTDPSVPGALTVIRFRTDGGFPLNPADGIPLLEVETSPGGAASFDHIGLTNGTAYHYSVFVIDAAGNASAPSTVQATPVSTPPDVVENLHRTDTK